MKSLMFFVAAALYMHAANAQIGTSLDVVGGANTNGYGQVRFTNASALGDKPPAQQLKDADVDGSPWFDERWCKAVILLQSNEGVKVEKCRLDLYRNELHYINAAGLEMTALSNLVKKVFFIDRKDTSKIGAVFQQIAGVDGNNATAFVQVLNSGKTALLKFVHVTIFNKGFDAIAGKNNYTFLQKATYCLLKDGVVNELKGLDEKEVAAVVLPNPEASAWLAQNKNKLHNEKDIISFLNYYNSTK